MDDKVFAIPVNPVINPLDQNDKETLLRIIEDNKAHMDLISRCEACSIPVDEKKERCGLHGNLAKMILEQFFPIGVHPDKVL